MKTLLAEGHEDAAREFLQKASGLSRMQWLQKLEGGYSAFVKEYRKVARTAQLGDLEKAYLARNLEETFIALLEFSWQELDRAVDRVKEAERKTLFYNESLFEDVTKWQVKASVVEDLLVEKSILLRLF